MRIGFAFTGKFLILDLLDRLLWLSDMVSHSALIWSIFVMVALMEDSFSLRNLDQGQSSCPSRESSGAFLG